MICYKLKLETKMTRKELCISIRMRTKQLDLIQIVLKTTYIYQNICQLESYICEDVRSFHYKKCFIVFIL